MAPVAALLISRVDPRVLMSVRARGSRRCHAVAHVLCAEHDLWQLVLPQLLTGLGVPLVLYTDDGSVRCRCATGQTASAAGTRQFHPNHGRRFRHRSRHQRMGASHNACARQSREHSPPASGDAERASVARLSAKQALQTLGDLVQSQAVMLATNQM